MSDGGESPLWKPWNCVYTFSDVVVLLALSGCDLLLVLG